ncbi:ankyrin repeat-containing domain protein [Aspergillus coremiiformis]|uniref:Ankyrin repeat-containing domain protein n=1 Tax=Aspergillus coremiiformis TaxID=138285 RepID=A0A5N6Z6C2_9EURO|nr:ankyrin repeat-containing domain protein [Aspergillus coremiiformis]
MDAQLFLHAAATGDVSAIQQAYLKSTAILTARDPTGRTALHLAVLNGHLAAVERLLDYGISPCLTDHNGQTALYLAAQLSSATIAETLFKRGATCCTQDADGKTPLFYAYQNHCIDVVSCFLKSTAACAMDTQCSLTPQIVLKARANRKWTPLHAVRLHGP